MTGATFDWTFPQAFAGNTAPPLGRTDVTRRGTEANGLTERGTNAVVSTDGVDAYEVNPQ